MNGFRNDYHHTPAGGYRSGDDRGDAGDGWSQGGPYPPVSEIFASAAEKVNEMRKQPIGRLLEEGKARMRSAKLRLDTRKNLAAAYWEYLVAYHISVDAIPSHPDYYDKINQSRSQLHRDYRDLTKDINSYEERFRSIKNIITNDNKRNGAQHLPSDSSRPPSAASLHSSRTDTAAPPTQTSAMYRRDDELMLPDAPSTPPAGPSESPRKKPHVHPKPQSLHGRALHQSSPSLNGSINSDDLAARFAKLKGATAPLHTSPESTSKDFSVKMPSPSDYHSSSRPLGPRDMPTSYSSKPFLNTELAASMPKEPSPTYSPARNLVLPESIKPPRSSARSIVGTGGRSNSMQASSASAHPPHANGDTGSYFPDTQNGHPPAPAKRQYSISKPGEDQIPVEKFYDYTRMYNILIIDVRSREEFDAGHINRPSVMCIEPTVLQDGCSADQLYERLILSPDEEQAMFDRRDEYDLVVYYDECTKTSAFLRQYNLNEKERALKRLYDSLLHFHGDRPLRRPPMFLMGGLTAWVDMLGAPGLKMSSTSAVVATKQTKPARMVRRVTGASHGDKLSIQKRRMREYIPMDPEEERRWLEEARQGRVEFDQSDDVDGNHEVLGSPLYQSTEEFLRRFPEVEYEPESMVHAPRRPPPPPQYAPPAIPVAPSRPAPSVPRVSYSGVHERQDTPQGRSAQLPVYISPGRYSQARLHCTGLMNFGVTCYMNSVVQCLCGNSELVGIFLSRQYEKDLQKDNWKGTRGILSEAFATLLSNLFKGDVSLCRPSTLRRVCGKFNSQWGIDEQQDAKEFLEFILDHLHEDLNVAWNKAPLKQLTEEQELTRERLPIPHVARIEWGRYQYRERSLIGSLFAGQHASRLTCMTCGTTSTTYEAFWSISVEIPHDRPGDLKDCLRSYCANERLSEGEEWRCPRCKRNREARKKITITRAPDNLVIHFKRFNASHTERAHKIRTPIHFPLRGLDLGPFMVPPLSPEDEANVMQNSRDAAAQLTGLKTDPAMIGPFQYNAYAVIWHLGNTLGSGHYVAHVRDKAKGTWRQFNDDKVMDFQPSEKNRLQNEKAYIVFYERERVAG